MARKLTESEGQAFAEALLQEQLPELRDTVWADLQRRWDAELAISTELQERLDPDSPERGLLI